MESAIPSRTTNRRGVWLIGLVLVLVAMLGIGSGSRVSAHAELERADPPVNGLLGAPPQQVDLWFTETVDEGAGSPNLSVLDENGNKLDVTNLRVDPADRHHVAADLAG